MPVEVSGLTARDAAGVVVGIGDPVVQAAQIFDQLGRILSVAGADYADVTRVRTFTTDIRLWSCIEDQLRHYWPDGWPVSTFVEVSRLFDERHVFEVEATAAVPPA